MAAWRLRVLAITLLAVAACDRGGGSPGNDQPAPAPSSSVVILANEIGACADVEACVRECEGGSADRCRRLAASYGFGKGVPRDEAKATELYEKACGMGDGAACTSAGQMYEYHHGVAKDDTKAAMFYGQGCAKGWAAGCYNEGIMFENGRGVPKDTTRALQDYDKACGAGSRIACDAARTLRTPR